MALAYDWTYQEWLKSHPKDAPKPVAKVTPTPAARKVLVKAQAKPVTRSDPTATWSPQLGRKMGFKTRAEWRAWKNKAQAGGQRASYSGSLGYAGAHNF